MTEKLTFDLSYPSTVNGKKNLSSNSTNLCPYHEKQLREKEDEKRKKQTKRTLSRRLFNRWSFKSALEKKLQHHGIKLSIKTNKQKIKPWQPSDEPSNKFNFTLYDLKLFTSAQINVVIATFQQRSAALTKEFKDLTEEKERLAGDTDGLQLTVRNLEELSLRMMKPWVNTMPHSDELTRVMLLN